MKVVHCSVSLLWLVLGTPASNRKPRSDSENFLTQLVVSYNIKCSHTSSLDPFTNVGLSRPKHALIFLQIESLEVE